MLSVTTCTFILIRIKLYFEIQTTLNPEDYVALVCMAITLTLGVLVVVLITSFGLNHCHLIFNNLTSLEYWQAIREMDEAGGITQPGWCSQWCPITQPRKYHPYDIGFCENFTQIFGNNPLCWFLPIPSGKGNGAVWKKHVSEETEHQDLEGNTTHSPLE